MAPLPAHHTKHLRSLSYSFGISSFSLSQLDDGRSNGTALWLGAQCLSLFLADIHKRLFTANTNPPRVVELGSGIGLMALALSSLGCDVLATDVKDVTSTVLLQNIAANSAQLPINAGSIQVRELDWTVPPDHWTWHNDNVIAAAGPLNPPSPSGSSVHLLNPPFDLIVSSDTLYSPELTQPLLRSIRALCIASAHAYSPPRTRGPPVYLCLERRDSSLIDQALLDARDTWGFRVERIPHKKVAKAMEKGGLKWHKDDWAGVEIWKLTLEFPQRENLESVAN
ncbi:hypothetical protein SERLA73DRAFT_112904 [Serpula lacrymans var. lacrymans S7.3]|uniref:Uncharacterized protein n=2 Tax=Serpula lacrymans var. lacrymans TaxID=341189 RepID=F8Q779_SERL3|nr:uncharacterized protein SERLADRAFT_372744 [Serpula lacrymans var. lacrymans S7.9]EGN95417.1 hypothetical protein SERLA73DRAFT_112904 [Serpula lacrymans var. lacrymans S7.3]EGO20950.1 hypothetical protein SERLADRAFT_372744 [Serpula lacrymans var. lacrymans S7.9]